MKIRHVILRQKIYHFNLWHFNNNYLIDIFNRRFVTFIWLNWIENDTLEIKLIVYLFKLWRWSQFYFLSSPLFKLGIFFPFILNSSSLKSEMYKPSFGGFVDVDLATNKLSLRSLVCSTLYITPFYIFVLTFIICDKI
jgi:hypothetical protein